VADKQSTLNKQLIKAVKKNDVALTDELLNKGAYVQYEHTESRIIKRSYYQNSLGIAYQNKNYKMIHLLISWGANPLSTHEYLSEGKLKTMSPFIQALKDHNEDIALMMIENTAFHTKNASWRTMWEVGGGSISIKLPQIDTIFEMAPHIKDKRLRDLTYKKFGQQATKIVSTSLSQYLKAVFNETGQAHPLKIKELCQNLDAVANDMKARSDSFAIRGAIKKFKQ